MNVNFLNANGLTKNNIISTMNCYANGDTTVIANSHIFLPATWAWNRAGLVEDL